MDPETGGANTESPDAPPADIRVSRRSSSANPTPQPADNDVNDGDTSNGPSVVSTATANAGVQRVEICFPDLSSAILNARGHGASTPNLGPNPNPMPAMVVSVSLRQLLRSLDEEQAEQDESVASPGPVLTPYIGFASAFRKLDIYTTEDLLLIKDDLISCGKSPARTIIEQLKEACGGDFEHDIPTYPQMARILQRAALGRV
jgi:hypothetical protein